MRVIYFPSLPRGGGTRPDEPLRALAGWLVGCQALGGDGSKISRKSAQRYINQRLSAAVKLATPSFREWVARSFSRTGESCSSFLVSWNFPPSLFISICLFEKRDNEFGSFVFFLKEKQKLLKIEKIQHDSTLRYF